jgi:hypothetical protein
MAGVLFWRLVIVFPALTRLFSGPLPELYVLFYPPLFKLILPMPAIDWIYGRKSLAHSASIAHTY